ncbi:peptidylprolyl isomerase [Myxococcota bacterium]|nr:peptidylprolyl isomerase [Myxococcota bacterium]
MRLTTWMAGAALITLAACTRTEAPQQKPASGTPHDAGAVHTSSTSTTAVQPLVPPASPGGRVTFAEQRRTFKTQIVRDPREGLEKKAPPKPPAGLFDLVKYTSPAGQLWAYVTPAPKSGGRRPAIVWVPGGFSGGISAGFFGEGPADDDQTASAFRQAGLVLMIPSLRGSHDNPGRFEQLYGEVDDLVAAIEHVRALPYVDPDRVYVGGHSTGATLVLLAAALTDHVRAGFAFGPIEHVGSYGLVHVPYAATDEKRLDAEMGMRSPILWVQDIVRPIFVFEGEGGNALAAAALEREATSKRVPLRSFVLPGHDHFSALHHVSQVIATKILADTGAEPNLSFTRRELAPSPLAAKSETIPEGSIHLQHILLRGKDGATADEKKALLTRAEQIRARVDRGEEFEAVAAEVSQGPTAKYGGDLGVVELANLLPEVRSAVEALKPGKVSAPIDTPQGVQLFRVPPR